MFKKSIAMLTSAAFISAQCWGLNQGPVVKAFAKKIELATEKFNNSLVDVELKDKKLFEEEGVFSDTEWTLLKPLLIHAQRNAVRLSADDLAFIVVAKDGSHQARISSSGNGKFLIDFNQRLAVYTPSGDPHADIKSLEEFFASTPKQSSLRKAPLSIETILNLILPKAHAIEAGTIAAIVIAVAVVVGIYYVVKTTNKEIKKTGETTRESIRSTTNKANKVLDETASAIRDNKENISEATKNLRDASARLKDAANDIHVEN